MENKQQIWAKTVLVAYKYLGAMCGAIDKLVESTAKHSYYTSGVWQEKNSIQSVSKKLIRLSDKKIDYINLKVMVDKVLGKIPKKFATLLILRYINRVPPEDIAELNGVSVRSYYRYITKAINEFAVQMKNIGYNYCTMEVRYLTDSFITSIYDAVLACKREYDIDEKEAFLMPSPCEMFSFLEKSDLVKVVI